MKTISSLLQKLLFISFFLTSTAILFADSPVNSGNSTLKGYWLGELEIPGVAKLRMGLTVVSPTSVQYTGSLNIIDQSTGEIPFDTISFRNDTLTAEVKKLGIVIWGPLDAGGNKINGEFRQAGARFPVLFTRVDKLPELLRPQEPNAPFPYSAEEVVFGNKKDGVKLSGTLTIPSVKGKATAVILVTGSGQQDRNEEIGKHKPFLVIADYLTRHGIVVLRYDDRGKGGSTGNFDVSTTGDFANDVLAGIAFLKTRKEVNPRQIGIIGHSEGGTVATIAASESSDVAFIIALAGLMRNFDEVVLAQLLEQSKQMGKNDPDIELERKWRQSIYDIVKEKTDSSAAAEKLWAIYNGLSDDEIKRLNWPKGRHEAQIKQVLAPWWRYGLSLDNRDVLMKVNCPVLALYGELDKQVDADDNIKFVQECITGKKKNVEIVKLPGLNHLFQTAGTGSEYEYIRIEETISPSALSLMSEWIEKNF
jgi:uncharacterized protein